MERLKLLFNVFAKYAGKPKKWAYGCLMLLLLVSMAGLLQANEVYSAGEQGSTLSAVSPLRQQMKLTQPTPSATGGRGFMIPQTVVARDAQGMPLAGVAVNFEVSGNEMITAVMRGYNSRIITVTTDANGMASAANTYDGYSGEGYQVYSRYAGIIQTVQVKASVPGGNTVTFNVEVGTYGANLVDNTPPFISVSAKDDTGAPYIAGTWTSHSVTVSYSATDSLSTIQSCTPEQTFSNQGDNQSSTGTAVDSANNSASVTFGPIRIDKTAPVTTAAYAGPKNGSWYDNAVEIKFTSDDSVSGVQAIFYKLGNGAETRLNGQSGSISIDTEGTSDISYWAVDNAGNAEAARSFSIKIDKSAPEITASASPGKNEKGWNNSNVALTLTATDVSSGVKEIRYKIGENGEVKTVAADRTTFAVNTEGTTTVYYWATDNIGRDSNVGEIQIKIDKTIPVIRTPADITLEATAINTPVNIGNADVSDISEVTLTNDAPAGGFPIGTTRVTWTAVDSVGNVSSAVQNITVKDTTNPVLTVQGDIVVEATGIETHVTITPATATDIFGVTITNDAPDKFPVGTTPVIWTAEDANGNAVTALQNVIVIDSTKPVLTVPENMTVEATARRSHVEIGDATATDIFPVEITNNAPVDFPLGETTVTWTATDANNNISSGSQKVFVQDTTKPDLTIPEDITVEAAKRTMELNIGKATATDIFNVTVTNNAPDEYPVGTTDIIWQAVDENGNTTDKTQKITVTDTIDPVITVPDDITAEATDVLTYVPVDPPECADIFETTISSNGPADSRFPFGTTVITWTATDANGNTATCTQKITIQDTTAPVLTAPADIITEATGERTRVNVGVPEVHDIFQVTVTTDAKADYPVGTRTVTWTATDEHGNVTTKTQTVTVQDTTAPTLTVPGDKTVEATAVLTSVDIGEPEAHDIFRVEVTNDAPEAYPYGTTTVTWTATDEYGNMTTKTQNVTVQDTTAPVFTTPVPEDITVEATDILTPVINLGDPEVYDIFKVTLTNDAPGAYPYGTTTVTWTATDEHGNSATITRDITVQDTTAPTLTVPEDITAEATEVQTPVELGEPEAYDIFRVDVTNDAPEAYSYGTTTVTWTATDEHGNVTTKTQTVTIQDTTVPTLTVPEDKTVEATAVQTLVELGDPEAYDIFRVDVTNDAPEAYPYGTTTVTWTATDEHGNVTTKTQTVTVQDTTAPALTVPENKTVEAAAVQTPVELGEAEATDIFHVDVTNDAPEAYPYGTTTVTWTATDEHGNVTTKTQTVTVQDTTAPTLAVPEDKTVEATAVQTPVELGEAEAMDIFRVDVTNDAPEAYPVGTTTVTWTATDEHGNVTTKTQTVTVQDTTAPTLTVPEDKTVEATAVQTPVELGEAKATDIFRVDVTNDAPEAYPVGTTIVTWTATDEHGNVTTKTQNITVQDTTAPTLTVPEDKTVEATALQTPVELGEAEAADIFRVDVTNDAPEAYPVGTTTVTWTATDEHGNITTKTQTVTVQDTTAPVLTVPEDKIVEATAVQTPVELGEAEATDIFQVDVTNDAPEAYPVGITTVTWTAADEHGNVTTKTQTIIVQDTTAPTLTVPENKTAEATGEQTPVELGQPEATDIFKVDVTNDAPEDYPIGTTTVTWTATDEHGNIITKTQTVTVQDTTAPTLTVPADKTVEATAIQTPVELGEAEATDIFRVDVTNDATEAYPIGTTTVTWTAADEHGNVTTKTQTVTVQDTTAPTLTVPADITANATGVRTPVDIGQAQASDIFHVTVTNDAPADYPVGITTVTWTATDENGNVTTAVQRITVMEKLRLKAYNATRSAATNTIDPRFKLENTGTSAIDLSKLKIRYYYTVDGDMYQTYFCDYAQVSGGSNQRNVTSSVKGSFNKISGATNSDYYLEISFTSNAGTLKPGENIIIQGRFYKINYSLYNQTNDYSFNPTANDYTATTKITLYSSGALIGGTEP